MLRGERVGLQAEIPYSRVKIKRVVYSRYSLVDTVPERLLFNEVYSDKWLVWYCCGEVDKLVGRGHDERKLIKSMLPMIQGQPTGAEAADERESPKRKRGA